MEKYLRRGRDENVSRSVAACSQSFGFANAKNMEEIRSGASRNDIREKIEKRRGMSRNIQKNILKDSSQSAVTAQTP